MLCREEAVQGSWYFTSERGIAYQILSLKQLHVTISQVPVGLATLNNKFTKLNEHLLLQPWKNRHLMKVQLIQQIKPTGFCKLHCQTPKLLLNCTAPLSNHIQQSQLGSGIWTICCSKFNCHNESWPACFPQVLDISIHEFYQLPADEQADSLLWSVFLISKHLVQHCFRYSATCMCYPEPKYTYKMPFTFSEFIYR